jgi:hypothetical protein
MNQHQQQFFDYVAKLQQKVAILRADYWAQYSSFDTWQFWVAVLMLIVPLIVLAFAIDKEKIFLIGFYGLNIHVWFAYIDSFGVRTNLWGYPYEVIPYFPSFSLDGSLVPVTFMLVYQWTLNHNKNFFLYSFLTSCAFAFILKPILSSLDLFVLNDGLNYFHVLIVYLVTFLIAWIVTKIFLWGEKKPAH